MRRHLETLLPIAGAALFLVVAGYYLFHLLILEPNPRLPRRRMPVPAGAVAVSAECTAVTLHHGPGPRIPDEKVGIGIQWFLQSHVQVREEENYEYATARELASGACGRSISNMQLGDRIRVWRREKQWYGSTTYVYDVVLEHIDDVPPLNERALKAALPN